MKINLSDQTCIESPCKQDNLQYVLNQHTISNRPEGVLISFSSGGVSLASVELNLRIQIGHV